MALTAKIRKKDIEVSVIRCGEKLWMDIAGNIYNETELEFLTEPAIDVGDWVSYKGEPELQGLVEQINDQMLMLRLQSNDRMAIPVADCVICRNYHKKRMESERFLHLAVDDILKHICHRGVSFYDSTDMLLFQHQQRINSKDGNKYEVKINVEIRKR